MSGSSSGSVSSSTPWWTVSSPSRRSRSRGETRSGASWRAVTASLSRFSAFSVILQAHDLAALVAQRRLDGMDAEKLDAALIERASLGALRARWAALAAAALTAAWGAITAAGWPLTVVPAWGCRFHGL